MCDTRERRLIGLIDVDGHNFPNLCLMKLSSYHKSIGDVVEWWVNDKSKNYDIVYMSKVFGDEYTADVQEPENAKKVIKGGTGYAIKLENGKEVYHKELDPPLPFEIESVYPDYSLYPEYTGYGKPLSKQTAYGFLTRGCPRGCSFCHVAVKEGRCSHKVADLSQFWKGQGTICLSDPNILACPEWEQLLTQLRDSGAKIEFNQGLDARLITEKKAELLASMNLKTPHFAMDTMASLEPVKKGIKLYVNACKRIRGKWNWRNAKVFCLTNFDTTHEQDMQRISAIQECECQPYVMIYNKPSAPSITRRLQRWTNSTMLYAKTQDFMEYQRMNYKSVLEGSDEKRMRLVTYDCEVFAYDWLVTLKDKETGQRTRIWNDNEALKMALSDDCIYVGFNSKHYDQFIVKAIAADFTPQEIKKVNDFIIGGGQGWDCPLLKDFYFAFNNVDIKDDMQMGLSLKAIEGHLGISVQESTVPFDIDRPLTEAERRETEFYCDHDVDTAERLIDIRKDYLKNKVHIGRLAGLSDVKAMGMTNAKLTAAMLKATKKPHDDERKYVYPKNLKREYIPPEVFAFFDKMHDPSISDKELFSGKLEFQIGDCPGVVGYGGIHAAIPHYFFEETGDRVIRNKDVASYYPHLMTLCGYTSRNIPSAEVFENVLETRMKAKASGDKATANALKLVVNTTYGALLNKYNDLFDPLMGRSVCITGQLFLLELAQHLYRDIPGLKIVQLNTDGIMVECDRADLEKLDEICDEWQARTGFELEEDSVSKIAQKDVNNYVEVQPNGKSKAKGGYLVKGISTAGAFNINNSCCIVATALKEYFVNGIPVEETINGCDDIFQFQIIAKAGAKYREAYHLVDGVKEPVQKVNRVYATADERYGKLFKVKAEDESTAKIEMLPEHCIIDNDNRLSITDVDKTFYIEMAKKRVNDFMGVKPERKRRTRSMATTKTTKEISKETNVYQRLLAARAKFLEADVQKTGKNMHLSFKYFELNDIVPPATRIFTEVGLVGLVNFTADTATMTIINTDNPEETIIFTAPFNQIAPIVSNTGKQATNEMQALGSSITYMRRYLYMMALDICENDSIDANIGKDEDAPSPAPATKKAPATPGQRKEVKETLTDTEGNATPLQIKGLKAVLKKLREADPSKEDMIANIAVQTEGFTVISKSDCEELINRINEMIGEGGEE